MSSILKVCFLALCINWAALASPPYTQPCPLYGQNFPAPTDLSASNRIKDAAESAQSQFLAARNGTTPYGVLDIETTAFSVEFYSLDENEPLFTYHYTPPYLTNQRTAGVAAVDSDSVYRIGSVSKLWTVYLFLIAAGDRSWNDPITRYIPELEEIFQAQQSDPVNHVNWESITIGALASQMAGIGRDAAYSAQLAEMLESMGIPNQGGHLHSTCGSPELDMIPCNRSRMYKLRRREGTRGII